MQDAQVAAAALSGSCNHLTEVTGVSDVQGRAADKASPGGF